MYLEHGHFVLSQRTTATSQHKLWGVKQPHVTVRSVSRRTDVNRRPFTALRSEGVNDSIVARRQPLVILLLIRPKCIDRFVFKLTHPPST